MMEIQAGQGKNEGHRRSVNERAIGGQKRSIILRQQPACQINTVTRMRTGMNQYVVITVDVAENDRDQAIGKIKVVQLVDELVTRKVLFCSIRRDEGFIVEKGRLNHFWRRSVLQRKHHFFIKPSSSHRNPL